MTGVGETLVVLRKILRKDVTIRVSVPMPVNARPLHLGLMSVIACSGWKYRVLFGWRDKTPTNTHRWLSMPSRNCNVTASGT